MTKEDDLKKFECGDEPVSLKGVTLIGTECEWCSKILANKNDLNANPPINFRWCDECSEKFAKCPKCKTGWWLDSEINFRTTLHCKNCGSMSRNMKTGDIEWTPNTNIGFIDKEKIRKAKEHLMDNWEKYDYITCFKMFDEELGL